VHCFEQSSRKVLCGSACPFIAIATFEAFEALSRWEISFSFNLMNLQKHAESALTSETNFPILVLLDMKDVAHSPRAALSGSLIQTANETRIDSKSRCGLFPLAACIEQQNRRKVRQ